MTPTTEQPKPSPPPPPIDFGAARARRKPHAPEYRGPEKVGMRMAVAGGLVTVTVVGDGLTGVDLHLTPDEADRTAALLRESARDARKSRDGGWRLW